MDFVSFSFSILLSNLELFGHFLWAKQHITQFTLPDIWKLSAIPSAFKTEAPVRRFHNFRRQSEGSELDSKRVGWVLWILKNHSSSEASHLSWGQSAFLHSRWERANFFQRPWKARRKTTMQWFWINTIISSH